MGASSNRTRPAVPLTDAEYAALCQCACSRVPRSPHSAFECANASTASTEVTRADDALVADVIAVADPVPDGLADLTTRAMDEFRRNSSKRGERA